MGWVSDSADLALALAKWARERIQSGDWQKKLQAMSTDLLRENVDLRIAEEMVRLAHEAGYAGPEIAIVEERIKAIRAYERSRTQPPREVAMRTRRKRAAKKPGRKKTATTKRVKKKAATTKRLEKKAAVPKRVRKKAAARKPAKKKPASRKRR
jgi:hypothetical protein